MEDVIALGILKALFYMALGMGVVGGGMWLLASLFQRVFDPYHFDTKPYDEMSRRQQQLLGARYREQARQE